MRDFFRLFLAVAAIAGLSSCSDDASAGSLTVAAASDLRPVLDPIAEQYRRDTGVTVTVVYGSSGQLATQIAEGSPVDLFFSADRARAEAAAEAAGTDADAPTVYALARLAVWVAGAQAPGVAGLADGRYVHIAIANPEHAPYGKAAEEALRSAAVFDAVESRLVLGENVADALRLATSGNADAAIVALSLAKQAGGSSSEVPTGLFTPLEQTAVVTTSDPTRAAWAGDLLARFTGDEGRRALADAGFGLPG